MLGHPVHTVLAAGDMVLMLARTRVVRETIELPVGDVVLALTIDEEFEQLLLVYLVVRAYVIGLRVVLAIAVLFDKLSKLCLVSVATTWPKPKAEGRPQTFDKGLRPGQPIRKLAVELPETGGILA